tara:strand:- start:366 stop:569 length:204 start_codon:yes stop_codon:yes gene_type:complete
MKEFVLVMSMWGHNGLDWEYIGNQYIYNTPMTKEECEVYLEEDQWSKHIENQFYSVQFNCFLEKELN